MADQFSTLLDAIEVPVVLVGRDERVSYQNSAAVALLGEGLVGRHYITAFRQPDLLDAVEQVVAGGAPSVARYLFSQQSRDATYEAKVTGIAGEGAAITFLDTSQLEEAGQIRRDFVANVSHELRTPLTAMAGFVETLRGAAKDDPAARDRFLDLMAREATRMNRLVDDLLSLSRVESDERVRPTDQVSVHSVIRAALDRYRVKAAEAKTEIEEDLGPTDLFVSGDADQLTQVISNLVENALKYGSEGGKMTVRTCSRDYDAALRAPAVLIEIVDYGEGIDPVHIPRLTERFYRVDDHRSRQLGGTGLGLAIVKHIVGRHRGRLRIDSEQGKGTTISILLAAA